MGNIDHWSSDAADRFRQSLKRAIAVRPMEASGGVSCAIVATAADRVDDGHWVNMLPVLDTEAFSPSSERTFGRSMWRRCSAVDNQPAHKSMAVELLRQLALDRAVAFDSAGRRWSSRLAPSAGGTHSIRPLLFFGPEERWYRLGDDQHVLHEVSVPTGEILLSAVADAIHARGTTVIFAVAEPEVLFARYPAGDSLMWRDAGAFLATAQFAAHELGMSAMIAGIAIELEGEERSIPAFVLGAVALTGGGRRA